MSELDEKRQDRKKNLLAQREQEKAALTLPKMLEYLAEHSDRHTPFMDRWFRLCIEHKTQIYPIKRLGCAVGKRLKHGTPARIVECIESAAMVGKAGVWYVKVVA